MSGILKITMMPMMSKAKKKYTCEKTLCCISRQAGVDLHHWKSRGSGGTDDAWNLMPLKHKLHQEFHTVGPSHFLWKYPAARAWLEINGWVYCDVAKKWHHY